MTGGDEPAGRGAAGPMTSPTGEPAAPEQVGLALRSIGVGVLAGAGLATLSLWGARMAQGPTPTPETAAAGPAFLLVVGGAFGGTAVASALTWVLLRPMASAYRRGGFSMVAGFATFLAILPTVIVDHLAGRWGLLGFAALCAGGCLFLSRRLYPERPA